MTSNLRRTGRPDAQSIEVLNRHILATATMLFAQQGYAATSIEQIAALAEIGKQTIYRRYASKEELFIAVVLEMIHGVLDSPLQLDVKPENCMDTLRELCWNLMNVPFSRPQSMALYRIMIAESARFPELAGKVIEAAFCPIENTISRLLDAARSDGQVRSDVPLIHLCRLLGGMCTGWIYQQHLLGNRDCLANETERKQFFDSAWSMFLAAVQGKTRSANSQAGM